MVGGVLRVLVVVGAVFDVAVLNAGAASADGPVQLKSRLGDVPGRPEWELVQPAGDQPLQWDRLSALESHR